tara:strand:- start:874 stop:1050 length:177 start_codon:yes stop_codon:yes gene_type:complete
MKVVRLGSDMVKSVVGGGLISVGSVVLSVVSVGSVRKMNYSKEVLVEPGGVVWVDNWS